MTRYFADVSSNQTAVDLDKYHHAGHRLIGLKASEGVGYTDPTWHPRMRWSAQLGLGVIHYHYARPDLHGHGEQEARYFAQLVGPHLKPYDAVALDLEVALVQLGPAHIVRYARQFEAAARERLGRPIVLYSYLAYLDQLGGAFKWPGGRLWVADYAHLRGRVLGHRVWAHQFTDGAVGPQPRQCAGVGHCDVSLLNRRSYLRLVRLQRRHR